MQGLKFDFYIFAYRYQQTFILFMQLSIEQKDIAKFQMVGDKVLIKPKNPQSQTKSGLYLPPTIEKDKIHSGYIVKTGPGFPMPASTEERDVWKDKQGEITYLSL